jgi:hypothetical protein
MNPTDGVKPESFYAQFILPLSRANLRMGVRYLNRERRPGSYWGPVTSRTGGLAKIPAEEANGEAMLKRLGRHWQAEGDKLLPKLAPLLGDLRRAILEPSVEIDAEPALPDFVYPLF